VAVLLEIRRFIGYNGVSHFRWNVGGLDSRASACALTVIDRERSGRNKRRLVRMAFGWAEEGREIKK